MITINQKNSGWFPTYTGIKFYPRSAKLNDIYITDIAHSLSMQCRFAGHIAHFYSIAQHSILVSQNVPQELALEGLLHDAAEAYCQDLIRPLKHSPGFEAYREIEHRLEQLIAQRFGLVYPWPAAIKEADNALLQTERRDLYPDGVGAKFAWNLDAQPLVTPILPTPPHVAEERFLRRFRELYEARPVRESEGS